MDKWHHRIETRAVHAGMAGVRESGSHVPVIDLSTTNPLADVESGGLSYEELATGQSLGDGRSAVYQRLWQPGVARFEDALAELESTEGAVAFASGMAALSACLIASVTAGRPHVVAVRPLYGGTDHVLESGLLGTSVTWARVDEVAASIRPDTGLVIVETPANPTLELVDIADVVAAAGTVPVLVDNTFATPILQQPARHGATLVLHSATKYLGGHGDVMGGVVAANEDWVTRLRQVRALTGGVLHPMAAYLLHRGLRTLPLRVRAQQETARVLAERISAHPAVARVHYPGLPGQDPVGLIGRQLEGPGAIIAVELAGGYDAAARFTEACDLIEHAVSLGGIDSLVQHPASLTHRPVAGPAKPGAGVVRISVGLEHVDDLTDDVSQALAAAGVPVASAPSRGVPAASAPSRGVPVASAPSRGVPAASAPSRGVPAASAPRPGISAETGVQRAGSRDETGVSAPTTGVSAQAAARPAPAGPAPSAGVDGTSTSRAGVPGPRRAGRREPTVTAQPLAKP